MSGPWEQYQSSPAEGPWAQYAKPGEFVGPQKPLNIGAAGLPEQMGEVARYTHPLGQLLGGIGGAMSDLSTRAGQAWAYANRGSPNAPTPELTQQQQIDLQANRGLYHDSPMANLGNIGANIGLTWPAAGALYQGGRAAASAVLPSLVSPIASPTAGAALTGGAMSATQPTLPGESLGGQLQSGAIGGAVGDALLRGGARAVQPIIQSAPVQNLVKNGIIPTIGQAAGGVAGRLEEAAMSWPFIGDVVRNQRMRAAGELNTGGVNLQMPQASRIEGTGTAGINEAKANLGKGYEKLYEGTEVGRDAQLLKDLDNAAMKPIIPLSEEYKRAYDKIIKSAVLDRLPDGAKFPTGEVKTQIEGELGKAIRDLGPMPSGQDKALQTALLEARTAVRDLAARGAGIDQAERKALDRGYANMKDMEAASKKAETSGGVATPYQIIKSAKEGSRLQQLGRDAQEVMGNKLPNSGTTDRYLASLLIGGAGAAASNHDVPGFNMFGPAYWLGLGASPLLYSRMGSRYALGDLMPGQAAFAAALRQSSPLGAQAGALYQR